MDYEEYKRKALEPIVSYIESVMASYSKEELEARIKDEKMLNRCISKMTRTAPFKEKAGVVIYKSVQDKDSVAWPKSLRPRPHWRPNEEQMMALQTAVADSLGKDYHSQLSLLEFDLRKLM